MESDESHKLELEVMAISEAALLLSDGDTADWIPMSLIKDFDMTNEIIELGEFREFDIYVWKLMELGFI